MRSVGITRCSARQIIAACFAFALVVCAAVPSQGQGYAQGQPLTGNITNTVGSTPLWVDPAQFSGTALVGGVCAAPLVVPLSNDMCGKIQAALCSASTAQSSGVIVDARGFTGDQTCGSNPFAVPNDLTQTSLFGGRDLKYGCGAGNHCISAPYTTTENMNVTILLPGDNITLSTTIFMPQQGKIIGLYTGGQQTDIIASNTTYFTSLPSSNCDTTMNYNCLPMICMGGPLRFGTTNSCDTPAFGTAPAGFTNTPRIQIENVKIDANGNANMCNVCNTTAQEKSWVQNSTINNVSKYGIKIGKIGNQSGAAANQAQNSGPYTNLEVNWTGSCSTAMNIYGIYLNNGPSVTIGTGGHITLNGPKCAAANPSVVAVEANGMAPIVENLHVADFYTGVQIGDVASTNGFFVKGITNESSNTSEVVIANNSNVGTITSLFTQGGTYTIQDNQAGTNITAPNQIALYTVGVNAGSGNNTFNGLSVFNNGSAANPSLTFANSASFGFYSSGSAQIGLGSGFPLHDSHQFYSTGNVSILSGGVFGMSSSSSDAGAGNDTGVSRGSLAGITAIGTGAAASTAGTLQVSRLKTGSLAPTCTFTSGGGSGTPPPSCALDAGSTDSAGIIVATTGALVGSPAGTGTITLTFSSPTFGSSKPSCIFMASDAGGTWSGLAVMKDKTPAALSSDLFTWTNGTVPTALLAATAYWINYHCWAK